MEAPPDITIACDKGHLTAHKLILCEHSKYLQDILSKYPQADHPIVILTDLMINDVKILVNYMYTGELVITSDSSPTSLLRAAQILKIDSLTADDSNTTDQELEQDELDDISSVEHHSNHHSNHNSQRRHVHHLDQDLGNGIDEDVEEDEDEEEDEVHLNRDDEEDEVVASVTRRHLLARHHHLNQRHHNQQRLHNNKNHNRNHMLNDDGEDGDEDEEENEMDDVDEIDYVDDDLRLINSVNNIYSLNQSSTTSGSISSGSISQQQIPNMDLIPSQQSLDFDQDSKHLDKNNKIKCHLCNIGLSDVKCLYRHVLTRHLPEKWGYKCEFCDREFSRDDHLMRHYTTKHKNMEFNREKIRETRRLNREMAKNFHDQISTS